MNIEQRTQEWLNQRLGHLTASQFYRLMTEPKLKADKEAGNLSQGAMTYVLECAAEKLTGKPAKQQFTNDAVKWGEENEPIAKEIYEKVFECEVKETGYEAYTDNIGGSPDGLVGSSGLIEIKCPFTITSHLDHVMMKDLRDKPEYFWQCMGYLLITGREWIDFVSYSPHFPVKFQMKRMRLHRDNFALEIKHLEVKLLKAESELKRIVSDLNGIPVAKKESYTSTPLPI